MNGPKVGILFVTSGWFRQVGLQDASSDLSREVEIIGDEVVNRLSAFTEPVYKGVLFSEKSAEQAAEEILKQNVQVLIVSSLMWCEDQILKAALLKLTEFPIILLTLFPSRELPAYLPYSSMLKGSGAVGSLQFSGMLKREGRRFVSLAGYYRDDELYKALSLHAKAVRLKEKLKSLKVGMLPFPCAQMSTTFVDEFSLRSAYGVEIKYLELARLKSIAHSIPETEISAFRRRIDAVGYVIQVSDDELGQGIRYSLALQKLTEAENISVLAMNDVSREMHETLGLRPSLYNPDFSSGDSVVSMEADVAAGLGLYLLKQLSGNPALYTEVLGVDLTENSLLLGHAGYHDARNAESPASVRIAHDVEYKNTDRCKGACSVFKMKPGPVTLLNSVFHEKKMKWIAVFGESLKGPYKLEDTAHLVFRPEIPVLDLINAAVESGVSQHWLAVPGDIREGLKTLAWWLPADLTIYSQVD